MMKTFVLTMLGCTILSAQGTSLPSARKIADNFIALHPDSIIYQDELKSRRWNYEQGLMLEVFYQLWKTTGDIRYRAYLKKNMDHYIDADGSIRTYKLSEFNIDNITPGKALLRLHAVTGEEKYRRAADTIRRQLSLHPRTSEGGFWHKKIYPHQMWLDGLFMAEPFYALYSKTTRDDSAFNDIARQFLLIKKHAYDLRTGLYFHGWDESRKQRWADPVTGCSPNLWGRSLGWLAMALVDVLDDFPPRHLRRQELTEFFRDLMTSVIKQRDPKLHVWYQVIDKPEVKGNYPEASASAMFTYALAKGVNRGYLSPSLAATAKESFAGLVKQFVSGDAQGNLLLNDVVKVSGLGGDPYRDGSVEYYLSEPKRTNDFKGYGPFLLAAMEIEALIQR